uniref:NR LBD domain-containing protein n=2 Tax=Caenorhabditis tropicalis TaxID=1561998 RepID=A0A1I7UXY3_9PELO
MYRSMGQHFVSMRSVYSGTFLPETLKTKTFQPTDPAKDSILFSAVSQYVTRMLPCDETTSTSIAVPRSPKTTHQTIRTPLQLFRADSPLVNRISIEDRSQIMSVSNVNFQPRLVQNFCSFVAKSCTTAQFTNANKLLLIRFLLKQFHVFCQFNTGDVDVDNWKLDLMTAAPFKMQLYEFFKSSISQVPTATVFRDIIMCWLTYSRPWRYHNMSNPSDFAPAAKYRHFFEKNVEFYEVILGKIIKRFSAFEMCEELIASLRAVIEFAWKEPQTLLLRHIQLDIQPHSFELLEQMQVVVKRHRNLIKAEEKENSGFWNSLFGSGESLRLQSSRRVVSELIALMKDSDSYMGTRLMSDIDVSGTEHGASNLNITNANDRTCATVLNETPKSSLGIPDHYVDHMSNHMLLTPNGQRQVLNREKRFDYSKCIKDDPKAPVRSYELAFAVRIMTALALKMNQLAFVRTVGEHYSERSVVGAIARKIMYPPVPNLDPNATVPAYSARIIRSPPLLRLRVS